MIIKGLTLENFCCYYGDNTFDYENGLNVVLGHNGDGKTTVITALKWIFDPLFKVRQEDLVSAKRFAEITEGDSFEVKLSLSVEQYDESIIIEKGFTVSKVDSEMELTPVTETAFIRNKISGESYHDSDTKRILNRVFPPEYRKFSIFEGEAGTLKVVDEASLADLVRSFSSAKSFEELESVAISIKNKAEKAYISLSKADETTQRKIDSFDERIAQLGRESKTLEDRIDGDKKGYDYYQGELDELSKSSELSEDLNKVKREIKDVSERRDICQRALKTKYTDYLFDDFYILAGYERFREEFSNKIDALRQMKEREHQEKLAEVFEEEHRLSLVNGATPFPPGFPSEGHLNEALTDNICKVCNRTLDDHSRGYINKSLFIYAHNKELAQKNPKRYVIFKNDFIGELGVMEQSINIHYFTNSFGAAKENIKELINFNTTRESEIRELNARLEGLDKDREGIIHQTTASEEKLQDIVKNITDITRKMRDISERIIRNESLFEIKKKDLADVQESRRRTLDQLQPNNFKKGTIEILNDIQRIFSTTKEREYEQYLSLLGEKATVILKMMNPGEITGNIKLSKHRNEVQTLSVNDDGSLRGTLDNSGALSISISMAILFAIADMAAEYRDEAYPMIFDAPTGRFSPDRKLAFYEAIYQTGSQCVVVTLDFLSAKDGIPQLEKELFDSAKKHKAFWVLRERPFDKDKKETINTNIIPLES
jgi:DNA sulfur modification protein DndD